MKNSPYIPIRKTAGMIAVLMLVLTACEEVITVDLPIGDPKVVVEGTIETDGVPLVFLSRSFPFFGDVDINDLEALLIRGAAVTVSGEDETVHLMEYDRQTLINLSEEDFALIEPILSQYLGFEVSQDFVEFLPDISFYTVSPDDTDFTGEENHNYWLNVRLTNDPIFGNREMTARTYIPGRIALDSLWVEDHPNEEIDTLFQLRTRLDDPDTTGNYYRYFTRADTGPWLTAGSSAFDDAFLDGQSVPFTVVKGQTEREKLDGGDFDVVGYWSPGDTAYVRLSMIDEAHYDFWRTVENEKGNLGNPFGSFTVIASNVEGAVGIWGGYASTVISIVIPEEL